jgi:flagellar hook protein FlgE
VSGLQADAQNMGIISDNISNANTVGYKGSVDKFETLVTSPATATTYTPGGVLSRPFANVTQQGLLQATQSATDVAITGNGFLPVTNSVNTSGTLDTTVNNFYTRAGSFSVDKNGNLVNSAGFFLLGVPINQTTQQPATNSPSVQALSLVNVGTLTGIAKGTSQLSIGANLPAVETANTPLSVAGTISSTAAAGATVATDAGPYTVYSSTGKAYTLTNVKYTVATLPAPTTSSEAITVTGKITTGASSPLTAPAPATTAAPSTAETVTLGTLTVKPSGSTFTINTTTPATFSDGGTYDPIMTGTNLKLGAATAISNLAVDPEDVTAVVYDSLGVANNLTIEFSRTGGAASNTWLGAVVSMTNTATGLPATTTQLPQYLDGTTDVIGSGVPTGAEVKFNNNGTLLSGPTTLGGIAGLTMVDGAAPFGGSGFALNLGTSNTPSGLTQYSSKFAVSFLNQNGIAFSYRTGVSFDTNGVVSAVFANGETIPLYQIPLVNFANVDALQAQTGNVYEETTASGSAVANYAGNGGVGTMTPSSLEQSTVDLSTEFANMIITERSFSANARTITTADNELQEVVNLVR